MLIQTSRLDYLSLSLQRNYLCVKDCAVTFFTHSTNMKIFKWIITKFWKQTTISFILLLFSHSGEFSSKFVSAECDPLKCPNISTPECREDQFMIQVQQAEPCCFSPFCGEYSRGTYREEGQSSEALLFAVKFMEWTLTTILML